MSLINRKQSGFTFLELIIVLAIMSVLVIASNQGIQNGLRAKLKLQDQLDDMSRVRDALRVMERDINLAYHYLDLETEFKKVVQEKSKPTQPTTPPPPPGASTIPPSLQNWLKQDPDRKDPTTHFIGSAEELYFVTMNASRISSDVPQADFIKVGYYLSSCSKPKGSKEEISGKCLMRRSGNLVEGDITKGGAATILLENVAEFSFRYIGKGKQDWVSDWNTKTGDGATKGNFPYAVEINVLYKKGKEKKQKKISMQLVAPLHFPNNPEQKAAGQ